MPHQSQPDLLTADISLTSGRQLVLRSPHKFPRARTAIKLRPSQDRQPREPGSQPLVPPSLSSGFSFWNPCPESMSGRTPTMQRYRQDPAATLREQPPIVPAGCISADPQPEPCSDHAPGMMQQEPRPAHFCGSAAHPSDPAYREQKQAPRAEHPHRAQVTDSDVQRGRKSETQSHSSRNRHNQPKEHSSSGVHGRLANMMALRFSLRSPAGAMIQL